MNDSEFSPERATGEVLSKPRGFLRRMTRLLMIPLFSYLGLIVFMMCLERSLLYPAPRYPEGNWRPREFTPEEVQLKSSDGTQLHGWFLEYPQPKRHILYLHGNGEHVAYVGPLANFLRDLLEANVLVVDYRGYGRSEGKPYEAGLIDDGRAARAWLAQRAGVDETEIVLMGRSLGGAVAVALAEELPPRGLVLESTLSSMPEVAAWHFPWLPVKLFMRDRFPSTERIKKYAGPLLQTHSRDDEVIPYQFGQRLFEAAPGRKEFLTFTGLGGHNAPQPPEYYAALKKFLDSLPARPPGGG